MRRPLLAFVLVISNQAFAAPPTATAPPDDTARPREGSVANQPLSLEELQHSIITHHPLISAARQRIERAEGNELSARGYFDPTLKAQGKITTLGYYELRTLDSELRQRTGLWGLELFGGYRIGSRVDSSGPFPFYSPDQTLAGGEVRGGLELPVFRDGPIDAGRARMQSAEAASYAARIGQDRATLETLLAGAKAYYKWVSAGQKWHVAQETLRLAEERATQMEARAASGLTSDFDRLDNERMVYERRERTIAARREFEAASFELSLFLRGADGKPRTPVAEALPSFERNASQSALELDESAVTERLVRCHPTLAQARAELKVFEVEARLARNQVAPDLKLSAQLSQDIGDSTALPALAGTVLEAGFKLSMPLLLSSDRGQLQARQAAYEEKRLELRFAEERVRALVKDLASRIQASRSRRTQTERLAEASRNLARGERDRVESGASNLLFLNLRELAALDADTRLVDAIALEREVQYEAELLRAISCN